MRHEQLENHHNFDVLDVAEVWPNGVDAAHAPLSEIQAAMASRTTAAPDVPAAAGGLMAATYGGLLAAFPLLITHDRSSAFAIVIGAFYLVMFFAVPALFFRIESDTTRRPAMSIFLERGMQTATGHISGRGALVQMLVVPTLLTFGVIAIGLLYVVL
jgi:hypothetical protein